MAGLIPQGTVIGDYTTPCDIYFDKFVFGKYNGYVDVNSPNGELYIVYRDVSSDSKTVICASADTPRPIKYNSGMNTFSNNIVPFSYTLDNKTVYWGTMTLSEYLPDPGQHPTDNISTYAPIAWAMIYGGYTGYLITYDLSHCTGDYGNPSTISPSAAITNMYFTPDSGAAFTSNSVYIDGDGLDGEPIQFVWDMDTGHLQVGVVASDITIHVVAGVDPYADVDGEEPLPGDTPIPVPGEPTLSATTAGVFSLYAPSVAQMQALSDYLWTDVSGATTTDDILKEIVEMLKRVVANPLKLVLGLSIIPSQGLSKGAASTVHVGFWNTGVSMTTLTSQYFTVDCGTLSFSTVCGDTFLDYSPYSKFSVYLPYVGTKQVDANDFVGHTIGVKYRGDVVTGAVTAYITKDNSVMYQYSGSCALNLPLSAENWGNVISSAIQIAGAVGAGYASGGVAGGALAGASSVATNAPLLSPQVQHSGAVAGGAGLLGVQKPYVIREAVRFHSVKNFNKITGYPSFYYKKLSACSGYTKCHEIHLKNIPATAEEISEIESLLKSGVNL